MRRIFLDENLPHRIARSLSAYEEENPDIEVHHTLQYFGAGIKDVDLIPKIKEAEGVLITLDGRIRRNRAEIEALKETGVSVIILGISGNAKYDDLLAFIFKHWAKIKQKCTKGRKKPFVCKLLKNEGKFSEW